MYDDDTNQVTQRRVFAFQALSNAPVGARLVVLAGPLAGERVDVVDTLTIGRAPDCQLRVQDSLVSRRHAQIRRNPNGMFVIHDLDSRNGIQVNGERTDKQVLRFGDRIQVGTCVLLFSLHDPMEEQAVQRRKLEAIGRLGTGVAHDFNNLMGAVAASIDYLRALEGHKTLADSDVRDALDDIKAAAGTARNMTRRLLGFAQETHRVLEPTDVGEVCNTVIALARRTFHRTIQITAEIGEGLVINADAEQLHQLLMNLLLNARDAMPGGGDLFVQARLAALEDIDRALLDPRNRYALVCVSDTGVGMDDKTKARAFDPFFSTKQGKVGAGLGLAAVFDIARAHAGNVTMRSEVAQGTTFDVLLPLTPESELSKTKLSRRRASEATADDSLLIMLVDDEDVVRRSAARIVKQAGYRVLVASGGDEALTVYSEAEPTPDLVLMDLNMPGMTGDQAFGALKELDPHVPVVFVSGLWDRDLETNLRRAGALGFVQKPYEAATLREAIVQAMTSRTS